MPELSATYRLDASVEAVWEVLDDYGHQRWSPGIKRSWLTTAGPIGADAPHDREPGADVRTINLRGTVTRRESFQDETAVAYDS